MKSNAFHYLYWTKILGLCIIVIGVISFIIQHNKRGFFDLNELALGLSWGLVFIFFSKEKNDDEMVQALKFKALTRGTIIAFFCTHLFNYLFLNWYFHRDHDRIMSISAYQFFALTMIITTGYFHFLKREFTEES
jgi:hypothetical protein